MRTILAWPIILLMMVTTTHAAHAQNMTGIIGGGMTNSAADLSAMDVHGMAGVRFALADHVGFRVDGLLSAVPQGTLFAGTGQLVFSLEPQADLRGLYLLAGGSLVESASETSFAVNGGLGYRIPIQPKLSLILEGRYFRLLDGPGEPNMVLGTAGLEFRFR
jgi:hypothetical protein